jgi:hypothetical protein
VTNLWPGRSERGGRVFCVSGAAIQSCDHPMFRRAKASVCSGRTECWTHRPNRSRRKTCCDRNDGRTPAPGRRPAAGRPVRIVASFAGAARTGRRGDSFFSALRIPPEIGVGASRRSRSRSSFAEACISPRCAIGARWYGCRPRKWTGWLVFSGMPNIEARNSARVESAYILNALSAFAAATRGMERNGLSKIIRCRLLTDS